MQKVSSKHLQHQVLIEVNGLSMECLYYESWKESFPLQANIFSSIT